MRVGASSHGPPTRIRVEDSHEHRRPADRHRVRVVAVEPDHGLKTDPGASIAPGTATLEDQRMNVPALLTMAVLVGWLATKAGTWSTRRSEEHTSELQSQSNLVC